MWYRRAGDAERPPLLILHGGPGAAAYDVEPVVAEFLTGVDAGLRPGT